MKYFILFLISLFNGINATSDHEPQLTGPQLLEKAIAYHDPAGAWNTKTLDLIIEERRPDGPSNQVKVQIDIQQEKFEYRSEADTLKRIYEINKGACRLELNGSDTINKEDVKKYRMTCEFANLIQNYMTYLWGLPMKLKDPGTIVHEEVLEEEFQGLDCYKMKVTYEATVGKDIWYFYFKKTNYALHGYKFHKDESKNDGEYITLDGEEIVSGIKFPKARKWYYNSNDKFLGEDVLLGK